MSVLSNLQNGQPQAARITKPAITVSVSVDATDAMVFHMHPSQIGVVIHGLISVDLLTIQRTSDNAGLEVVSPYDVAVVRLLTDDPISDDDIEQFIAHNIKLGSTPAAMSMTYILHSTFAQKEVANEHLDALMQYYGEFLGVSSGEDRQSLATQIATRARIWLSADMHDSPEQTTAKTEQFRQFCVRAANMVEEMLPQLLARDAQANSHADAEQAALEQFETQQAQAHQLETEDAAPSTPLADNPYLETMLGASCVNESEDLPLHSPEHTALDLSADSTQRPAANQEILHSDDLQRQLMNLTALTPLLFVPRF